MAGKPQRFPLDIFSVTLYNTRQPAPLRESDAPMDGSALIATLETVLQDPDVSRRNRVFLTDC